MNREDAAQIQKLAIEACDTIKRMEEMVLALSREERSLFANHFEDAYTALQFGILREIHDRYPDLRPGHEEPPRVSSFLRWEDVCLPDGVCEADLDALIFSVLKPNWQKTAMVISKTSAECTTRNPSRCRNDRGTHPRVD
jgi:hypothetical protein